MPMTTSAVPMDSAARRASSGNASSMDVAMSLCGHARDRLCIFLHGVLQQLEELGDGGQDAVPVGNQGKTQRVLDELRRGPAQALGEGGDSNLLGMPVKLEAVQHGVGVITRTGILRDANVSNFQASEIVCGENQAFGRQRAEQRL